MKLLNKIDAAAAKHGKIQKILLEVNVSGEESKFGLSGWDALRETAEHALALSNIQLLGLMTMAPLDADAMSHDFPAAIAEGATIVRVGTAIFGGRKYAV